MAALQKHQLGEAIASQLVIRASKNSGIHGIASRSSASCGHNRIKAVLEARLLVNIGERGRDIPGSRGITRNHAQKRERI